MRRKLTINSSILLPTILLGWKLIDVRSQTVLDRELIRAIAKGDPDQVRQLVAHGANPNTRDTELDPVTLKVILNRLRSKPNKGSTALMLTCQYFEGPQIPAIVNTLITAGADVNAVNEKGQTASHMAAFFENGALATILLAHPNVNHRDSNGATPLMFTAYLASFSDSVPMLLAAGADPNIADNRGDTPLIKKAWQGDIHSIALYIKYGANVNAKNHDGDTAISQARKRGVQYTINKLKALGAKE